MGNYRVVCGREEDNFPTRLWSGMKSDLPHQPNALKADIIVKPDGDLSKRTKAGFIAWRRGISQSRLVAIATGRKTIDHRPSQAETESSEKRWDEERHQI